MGAYWLGSTWRYGSGAWGRAVLYRKRTGESGFFDWAKALGEAEVWEESREAHRRVVEEDAARLAELLEPLVGSFITEESHAEIVFLLRRDEVCSVLAERYGIEVGLSGDSVTGVFVKRRVEFSALDEDCFVLTPEEVRYLVPRLLIDMVGFRVCPVRDDECLVYLDAEYGETVRELIGRDC